VLLWIVDWSGRLGTVLMRFALDLHDWVCTLHGVMSNSTAMTIDMPVGFPHSTIDETCCVLKLRYSTSTPSVFTA
jgi:hypothetical protein